MQRAASTPNELTKISIHAPREGSDFMFSVICWISLHFYPRSPRGERRPRWCCCYHQRRISIHAPREGSDDHSAGGITFEATFLSTLPARGATLLLAFFISIFECISIHAPREGSDSVRALNLYSALCISIHAPREGSDHRGQVAHVASRRFLSTLPVRGATICWLWQRRRSLHFYPRSP